MCPLCGAEIRLGVWMSRTEVAVFDVVKRAGEDGAEWQRIAERLSSLRGRQVSRSAVKVHIMNIRDRLEETDWTIVASRGNVSTYCLKQRGYQCRSIKSSSPTLSAKAPSIFS